MNAAIADRLRDLLDRKWAAIDIAHRSWGNRPASRWALVHALAAYAEAFEREMVLRRLVAGLGENDELVRRRWATQVDKWLWTLPIGIPDIDRIRAVDGEPEERLSSLQRSLAHHQKRNGSAGLEHGSRLDKETPGWEALHAEVMAAEFRLISERDAGPWGGWRVLRRVLQAKDEAPTDDPPMGSLAWLVSSPPKDRPWMDNDAPAVRRFHDWVLDRLAVGAAATSIVERYVRGVSLFERDTYRTVLLDARPDGDTSNRDERVACTRMAAWLHAQGLDPLTELQIGNGRADVGVPSGPDAVAIEAKVVRPADGAATVRDRVLGGLTQARTYAERLGHPTGYLVVFWLDDASFLERRDEVRIGDTQIRVLVVDLRSKSPSGLGTVTHVPFPEPPGVTP